MSTDTLPLSDWLIATEFGAARRVLEALGTTRALGCHLLLQSGEHEQYLALSRPDQESSSFADDLLATEFMRKNPRLQTGINRKAVAVKSWVTSERQCRETNTFLINNQWRSDPFLVRVIKLARKRIKRTLGPLGASQLAEIVRASRHGPGATTTVRGKEVTPSNKMTTSLGVTPRLHPYRELITPLWQDRTVGFVSQRYDEWINVPKSATTDRGISINPGLNVYIQLGTGTFIRERLKLFGLDILDAQARHRWLATVAQSVGLSTIDLSAASDSICREVVRLLLPVSWWQWLDTLRTPHTRIRGIEVITAKFAAMGNGYTFELETLIFWALAHSVEEVLLMDGDADVRKLGFTSVYGDDIVVPKEVAHHLIEVLGKLGFRTNTKKTFLAGRFFESCGTDVYDGRNIRPFYLNSDPRDRTEAVILIANSIRLYARRRGLSQGCDKRFLKAWLYVVGRCSKAQRTGVPLEVGRRKSNDIRRLPDYSSSAPGLIRNFDEFAPKSYAPTGVYLRHLPLVLSRKGIEAFSASCGWSSLEARMWYHAPINYKSTCYLYSVGCYIVALHAGTPDSTRNTESMRGSHRAGKLKSTSVPGWTDIGPWVDLQGRWAA